jgi:hypothetical protein
MFRTVDLEEGSWEQSTLGRRRLACACLLHVHLPIGLEIDWRCVNVKPLRAAVSVILGTVILVGSGCGMATQVASSVRAGGSLDAHERSRVDTIRVPSQGVVAGNPSESAFGTVQADGTYCGVFCAENH